MVDSTTPVVSVIMITYLHESFIAEAINGVLMQKCDFDVELIIADDCSPDITKAVVESFKNHPNHRWIKYIRHETNKGMMDNFIWAISQAKGKFIALCEGDDYWTDTLKLQKQVDFLEKNKQVICVTHNVEVVHCENKGYAFPGLANKLLNTRDILFERDYNYLPTGSYVFRKSFFEANKSNLLQYVDFGDWPLIFQLSLFGDIYHMQDVMGVYRKHSGGYTALNRTSIQLRINNFYLTVGILYPEYWHECQTKMKMLENKIYIQREKELKSEDFMIYNNGLKKLFWIFLQRCIFMFKTYFSSKIRKTNLK